jgi:hypothetical protein
MPQSNQAMGRPRASAESKSGRPVQGKARSDIGPSDDSNGSTRELRHASDDLKSRIAEAKRRHDMPLDSALGNPEWEERAEDGRFDLPDEGEEA